MFCVFYLRTSPITHRRYTLSDVQWCVSVLQLGATALFAPLLPFAPHWVNHATHHAHLKRQKGWANNFKRRRHREEESFRSKRALTLSGRQLVSVQPQSLVEEDVMKPAGQVCVEFRQLHAHSNASQHFVFFADSWRCAGHSGGDWWAHSSFLHTDRVERLWETFKRKDVDYRYRPVFARIASIADRGQGECLVIPHSWMGWHSPGFFSTTVWPSSQRGMSGRAQFTRSHTKKKSRNENVWLLLSKPDQKTK